MKKRIFLIVIFTSYYNFSQIIQPSYHAGYQAYAPPITAPVGGNAVCDGTLTTVVNPITSPTGKIWMDRNLGASRAATAINDYQAYGCFYQWGRGNDGHASINWSSGSSGSPVNGTASVQSPTDTPGHSLFIITSSDWRSTKNNSLWSTLNGNNNPCPPLYRVPTEAEFSAEITSNNITTANSAYSSVLKISRPGWRNSSTGSLENTGGDTFYWTSTPYYTGTDVYTKLFNTSANQTATTLRSYGAPVRCIKN